jgi:hypothetical protein
LGYWSGGVNAQGQVVGSYVDAASQRYGFVTGPQGVGVTQIDPFESTQVTVTGINDRGQVAGDYTDPDGKQYGFLAMPSP